MAGSGNDGLSNEHQAAAAAVLAFSLAVFGAGGSNSGIDHDGMTQSRNFLLSLKDLAAQRANLASSLARAMPQVPAPSTLIFISLRLSAKSFMNHGADYRI